jgi:Leucine-rich repeat (LRR) protein
VLGLSDNQIIDAGRIALGVRSNTCLKTLGLSGNKIVEVLSLGEALLCNNALEVIYLDRNQISVSSFCEFIWLIDKGCLQNWSSSASEFWTERAFS